MKKLLPLFIILLSLKGYAQQSMLHWGLQAGTDLGSSVQEAYQSLQCTQRSLYDFGLQFRIGGRFYGGTGLNYFVGNQNLSTADSSCDIKHDYLGMPLRIGLCIVNRSNVKLRLEAGVDYRLSVYISPNDWNLRRNNDLLTSHFFGYSGGVGMDWKRLTLDATYRQSSSGLMPQTAQGEGRFWLSAGFLFH